MVNFIKKIIVGIIVIVLVLSFCACGSNIGILENSSNGLPSLKKSGNSLKFYSSDSGLDNFLNDYFSRHIRDDSDKAIGNVKLGNGWMFQKEWESLYLSWFDSTSNGINGYDALYNMASGLDAVYVSDVGSVAVIPNMPYRDGTATQGASMGWPFIGGVATGNYTADFFNSTDGWTINGQSDVGSFDGNGYWNYTFKGKKNESLVYEVEGLSESIEYAPLIEIAFKFCDLSATGAYNSNISDIVLSFKMTGGDWVSMSYKEDAIFNIPIDGNGYLRTWFPVYLHPEWVGELEALKIEIKPNTDEKLSLVSNINYVRLETDTLLTNTNTWFITGMEEYISFTGDKEMLERNMKDLRRAMMFQLYALGGINGLLKTDYVRGKTTTLVGKGKYGLQANGWYDLIPTGTLNLDANMCFLRSLYAMAKLEEYAEIAGISVGNTYIRNPYPYEEDANDIIWTQTPATLRALAETLKINLRKNIADGGLWNPKTGRFAWAVYDKDSAVGSKEGEAMDYGFVEANLTAVLYDIASESQKESIMSWINGTRIVDGDNSKGEDIYFYRFAPRVTTKDNNRDMVSNHKLAKFGFDIQNGGASMHVSYYDLLARYAYLGTDNAFSRLKEIQGWYEDVLAANGKGSMFYRTYYADMLAEYGNVYKMQGGGPAGSIGLDTEFYESALLYATVPYTFFGLDAGFDYLQIAPDIPKNLDYMALENLMFRDVRYDLLVTNSTVVISNVRGKTDGKVKIKFKAGNNKKVYINKKSTTDFVLENGYIMVEVPMAQCIVEIK